MVELKDLHPIGIGTWTISKNEYDKELQGLLHSLKSLKIGLLTR